jgi:hypothetical protein
MNLRIENDSGQALLKISNHKSDPTKAMVKVPVNFPPLIVYVTKWCAALGVTEMGSAWAGNTYWMQEVNKDQVLAAVGRLLSGEALPEVDIPAPTEPDEADYKDEEGLVS